MNRAYETVEMFEEALREYTRAPHVVCVDSCTNALLLSFVMRRERSSYVTLPKHTYVGVPQAAFNAGLDVTWSNEEWLGWYHVPELGIVDSAKHFERSMWGPAWDGALVCVSFHVAKRLPLGRGGAILLAGDDEAALLRRMRFDGRTAGETGENATTVTVPSYHVHMTPDVAARGLWLLEQFVDMPVEATWQVYPDLSEMFP